MKARALACAPACAGAWVVILSVAAYTGVMSKEKALLVAKLAAAGALGAVLPMIPEMIGAAPAPWASLVSAAATALALWLKSPVTK